MGGIRSLLGSFVASVDRVTVDELMDMIKKGEKLALLDIRTPEEHNKGRIPGSILASDDNLGCMESHSLEGKIIIYCTAGVRSYLVAGRLGHKGFNVADLKGGFNAWEDAGGAVEAGV